MDVTTSTPRTESIVTDLPKFIGLDDHKLVPNETDQVQPVAMGGIWEGDDGAKLLARSDRRILLAHWYFNATKKALKVKAEVGVLCACWRSRSKSHRSPNK